MFSTKQVTMDIIKSPEEMRKWSETRQMDGERVGLVPTMGYFHEGHLSLMDIAKAHASTVVVSLFVNPTQFGENEDLSAYPMDIDRDLSLAEKRGVHALFMPPKEAVYPPGYQTYVSLERLPHHLCGLSRPTHFRGVATVVTKLFNTVRPHVAVFGSKDFQQLQIIRQLNHDLDFGIDIIGAPIVREKDGLAMSSRNAYLKPEERASALSLSRSRTKVQERVDAGERDAQAIIRDMTQFIESFEHTRIDYISMCHPTTLDAVDRIDGDTLYAVAVHVGKARLIDNLLINT